jgi:hypothetical protein
MRLLTRLATLCILVLVCGLIAAFVVVNNTPSSIHLWPSELTITAEIWVFILGAFAAGMFVGGLFIWASVIGLRARLWARDRQVASLTSALQEAEERHNEQMITAPSRQS